VKLLDTSVAVDHLRGYGPAMALLEDMAARLTSTGRRSGGTPGTEQSPSVRPRWITVTVLAAAVLTGCGTCSCGRSFDRSDSSDGS
jgi:hypothetical protein